jgi:hypothetical protein
MTKNGLLLLLFIGLFSSCISNRYLLTDKGKDGKYLVNYIDSLYKGGQLSKHPLIIVDGKPYRYEVELKKDRLPISKSDILQLILLEKDIAEKIYGEPAKNGTLLLFTAPRPTIKEDTFETESKILILLEDKEIDKSEMEKIDPESIETVEIIKSKDKVKEYTSSDYDGVIIIRLKK